MVSVMEAPSRLDILTAVAAIGPAVRKYVRLCATGIAPVVRTQDGGPEIYLELWPPYFAAPVLGTLFDEADIRAWRLDLAGRLPPLVEAGAERLAIMERLLSGTRQIRWRQLDSMETMIYGVLKFDHTIRDGESAWRWFPAGTP